MSQILDPSDVQGSEYLAGSIVDRHMESAPEAQVRGDSSSSSSSSEDGPGGSRRPSC